MMKVKSRLDVHKPNTLERPNFIAHRGLATTAPENSIPAFVAAGENAFWAIETDVHKTKDGVLVCNHDRTVDAMYNGSGCIAEMTYNELMKLRLKVDKRHHYWPQELLYMPTFDEYLGLCKAYDAIPFIEAKTSDIAEIIQAACRFFREEDMVISSTKEEHLVKAREISKNVFTHHIFSSLEATQRLSELGNSGVSFNYPDYKAFPICLLNEAHALGVKVCLRAGDIAEAVRDMVEMGLDYIPTNSMTIDMMKKG